MIAHQKLDQSSVLYGSKSPAEKIVVNINIFKPAGSQFIGCLLCTAPNAV